MGDKKIANLFLKDVYYYEKAYIVYLQPLAKIQNSSLFAIKDHILYVYYTCVVEIPYVLFN